MTIEITKNRDIFLKMCFMFFLKHILQALGIEEEIEDILPTENISLKIRNNKPRIFNRIFDYEGAVNDLCLFS